QRSRARAATGAGCPGRHYGPQWQRQDPDRVLLPGGFRPHSRGDEGEVMPCPRLMYRPSTTPTSAKAALVGGPGEGARVQNRQLSHRFRGGLISFAAARLDLMLKEIG